jgi:hypothetical protein
MKRIFSIILFATALLIGLPVLAQDETEGDKKEVTKEKKHTRGEIKTLAGNGHSGGYGAIGLKTGEFSGEHLVVATAKGGWIINRVFAIGVDINGIVPTSKYDGITGSTDQAILIGGFGGLFIEPIVFSNQVVHVTFPVTGGAGWLGYNEDWERNTTNDYENNLIDDDVFWYVEPGAALEINVAKNFRINMGMSKRFTQDLQLINTDLADFEGYNYFFTFKFGKF